MTTLPKTRQDRIPLVEHGKRSSTSVVVIHTTEGAARSAINWFKNPKAGGVGAHLIVSWRNATQLADLDAICWHAPGANYNGIGIEHGGYASWSRSVWKLRKRQRVLSANRCAWICYHYNLGLPTHKKNVFGHKDFPAGGHHDPGDGWPWDLYIAAARRAYRHLVASNGRSWDAA